MRRCKNLRMIRFEISEYNRGEFAKACSHFKNGPGRQRAQLDPQLCEIACKGCRKERSALRRRSIIAESAPGHSFAPAVITFAFVVERSLHPIVETDRAFASDACTQTLRQAQI